jgi:hypothetical protein
MTCIYNLLEIEKEGVGCLKIRQDYVYDTHANTPVSLSNSQG